MQRPLKILILEDDPYFRADIAQKLARYGRVRQAGSLEQASALIAAEPFDAALIDLNLGSGGSGLEVIRECLSRNITPIVLTGNEDPQMIARAYELGGKHYFSKLDVQKDLDRELGFYLRSLAQGELDALISSEFVTKDATLIRMLDQLRHQNLNRDQRILLLGPTGVGKTKIAKLIHQMSEGSMENFVHLNAAEMPENLVESILFGHKKGAFTGATEDRSGFFAKADGGTLFLDEIGSISTGLQKKLLKVLEEKEFTPLGSTVSTKSDFRLIAATCEDIPRLIETKRFRLDLYFRLKGLELQIPALRERRGDIPGLVEHFARQGARRIGFSAAAIEALTAYDWHGNVRELEQMVKGFANSSLGLVNLGDLPAHVQKNRQPYQAVTAADDQKLYTRNVSSFIQKNGLRKFIQTVEREAFSELYARTGKNLTKTQTALGISKSAAYRILDSLEKGKGGADDFHA
jgi:DNA-binding NtrC family response regulator